jgi:Na+/melibiose symporter-like transporter
MHLHCHERFDINNDELLGIIWEHRKKKKARGEFFLVWKGIILVELTIICILDQISTI